MTETKGDVRVVKGHHKPDNYGKGIASTVPFPVQLLH